MDANRIAENCRIVLDRLRTVHLRTIADSQGPVVYISDAYPGVWLEHVYDGVVWAQLTGETDVARNYVSLFLDHQSADGQLPCYVWQHKTGYSQIQECVSFGSMALEVWRMTRDMQFLQKAYAGCCRWDAWLCTHRGGERGLIEMYSGYDTGHDNSGRLDGMVYQGEAPDNGQGKPTDCPVAPLLAPDMNAVFYGDRRALSQMAQALGLAEEAARWDALAQDTRQKLIETCYDPQDEFFYDVDKHGQMRRCRSISITNVLSEGVMEQAMADRVFDRHFRGGRGFDTPYPWPSVAADDPLFEKRLPGNSWGYYCQGLTMLRTLRWMKRYGYETELHRNMQKWLEAWTDAPLPFGQELDPFTGAPSQSSPWYSATMLFCLSAAKELGLAGNAL